MEKSRSEPESRESSKAPSGWIFILSSIAAIAIVVLFGFNQRFWLLPPEQKLEFVWKQDLEILKATPKGALFNRVRTIKIRATDHSPTQDWLPSVHTPIQKNNSGDLDLDVFLIHQIEGHRFGVIMQYAFLDSKTGNMVEEFARTLWLGIYY